MTRYAMTTVGYQSKKVYLQSAVSLYQRLKLWQMVPCLLQLQPILQAPWGPNRIPIIRHQIRTAERVIEADDSAEIVINTSVWRICHQNTRATIEPLPSQRPGFSGDQWLASVFPRCSNSILNQHPVSSFLFLISFMDCTHTISVDFTDVNIISVNFMVFVLVHNFVSVNFTDLWRLFS